MPCSNCCGKVRLRPEHVRPWPADTTRLLVLVHPSCLHNLSGTSSTDCEVGIPVQAHECGLPLFLIGSVKTCAYECLRNCCNRSSERRKLRYRNHCLGLGPLSVNVRFGEQRRQALTSCHCRDIFLLVPRENNVHLCDLRHPS